MTRRVDGVRAIVGLRAAVAMVTSGCTPPSTRMATTPITPGAPTPTTTTTTTTTAPSADEPLASPTRTGRTEIALTPDVTAGALVLGTPAPVPAGAAVASEVLSDDETAALLARLEPLPELAAANAKAPTLRAPSAMPARSGPVQPIAMIGPDGTVVPDLPVGTRPVHTVSGPLTPPELAPQGEVRSESEIRVRFAEAITGETLTTSQRHGVAVVDPLPAGFEAITAALSTAERIEADHDDDRWDHRNLRDDRSEAFAMEMGAGSHRFSYAVRATTPGTFIAAPARAEEMYSPETFGRSAGVTVTIE